MGRSVARGPSSTGFCRARIAVSYTCSAREFKIDANPVTGQVQQHGNRRAQTHLVRLLKQSTATKNHFHGRLVHNIITIYGFDTDTFFVNSLIQMYGECRCISDAQSVFDHGSDLNVYSWNLLINACAQNECLQKARSLFEKMPVRDVVSWNVIIRATARDGDSKEALHLFYSMGASGCKPSNISFVCALDASARLYALEDGKLLHHGIVQEGSERDCIVGTALITMYGKCENLQSAWRVFTCIIHQSVISWTAMIAAMNRNGHSEEALNLFYEMQTDGILPNKVSFVCAVDSCAKRPRLVDGQRIHICIVCRGLEQDVVVASNLINMYTECIDIQSALYIFHAAEHKNVVTLNVMMKALNANRNNTGKTLVIFCQWVLNGIRPDNVTYVTALEACSKHGSRDDGHAIHNAIIESQYEENLMVCNALVDMYTKCSSPEDARGVFRRMRDRDVISWTSLMSKFSYDNGQESKVLGLLREMYVKNVIPDKITLVCALHACCRSAIHMDGQSIHSAVVDGGYELDTVVGNALVNVYGKCGCLIDALYVFSRMPCKNVVSWTTMITVCAVNGEPWKALQCFSHMQQENVEPNEMTFISALHACSHTGYLSEAWQILNRDLVVVHLCTKHHYSCMVDLAARAGHLKEAAQLISRAPVADVGGDAWLSILAACRVHGDEERGLAAANQCFLADPLNTAPYVMLSNMRVPVVYT